MVIHPGLPFSPDADVLKHGTGLPVNEPPKLTFVSLGAATAFLKGTKDSSAGLQMLFTAVVRAMPPGGSVAVAVPRPWFDYGQRLRGGYFFTGNL